ncbi:MAG: hypothetical protein PVG07_00595 [Acidobacteriota bacterium]|jgi:hypothetical protein
MRSRRPRLLALPVCLAALACLLAGAAPAAAQQTGPPRPCADDPLHRQLDFWVGDWRVLGADGEPVGFNHVRRRHDGCVIEESWSSGGSDLTGQSMNYVDPRDGRWKQVWVDSSGTLVVYDGELRDGAMHFEGENVRHDGTVARARVVVEPVGAERLRHRIEHSRDGGESWEVVFDATYVPREGRTTDEPSREPAPEPGPESVPRPAPEPAPAPAPEPTPEPASEGGVRAASGAVPAQEVPLEERNRVHLESPMVLDVPVGPIESIPAEYSWSTEETSIYLTEGVSVRRVTLSRSERGGTVDVEVVAALHGRRYLEHADLAAELVWGGEVLASAGLEDFAVGRSVKAQSSGFGLEKELTLSVPRERFEEAFGGEERPVLKLTVAVRN